MTTLVIFSRLAFRSLFLSLPVLLILATILFSSSLFRSTRLASAQTIPALCSAAVEIENDLYLVSSAGRPEVRFTTDGRPKQSPTLAQDGSKVAFISNLTSGTFDIVDRAGQRRSYSPQDLPAGNETDASLAAYAKAPVDQVSWSKNSVIRTARRITPTSARFDFFTVPDDFSSALVREIRRPFAGAACAAAYQSFNAGCIEKTDVLVNDEVVFSKRPSEIVPRFDSVSLKVGSTVSNTKSPFFKLQVTSLDGGVTLRVTLPTGNWEESRIDPGDFLAIPFEGRIFNFYPTVVDSSGGLIKIDVYAGDEVQEDDRGIAWRQIDNALGVVERTNKQSTLLLLHKRWFSFFWRDYYVIGRFPLNIAEPIKAMHFTSRGTLAFETNQRFGEIETAIVPQGPFGLYASALKFGKTVSLPRSLTVNIGNSRVVAPVFGWTCLNIR
jgi:hypothetical protein